MMTEHVSVLEPCASLAEQGFELTYLKPNTNGFIDIADLNQALRPDTILVSIMHANNETGIIQNIAEIGALTKARKIVLHVDAVQGLGKIPIDLEKLSVDLMSFSAHKIYGPKGIGALYIGDRPRIKLTPQILGGGHERKLRAGTLSTHQIIGMGEACRIMRVEMEQEARRVTGLRNQLWQGIKTVPGISLNIDESLLESSISLCHTSQIVPGILNVRFEYHTKDAILQNMLPYAVSSAAACNGIHHEPSHVLRAMNLSKEQAAQSIRFSLGRFTTESDIAQLIAHIQSAFKS
jgi:cysteine desulfurase